VSITTTARALLEGVSNVLQDISPQFSRWPEREMVTAANLGQLAIAKYLPIAGARVDAIKLKPGTRQDLTKVLAGELKPGDGSAAADTFGIALQLLVRNMGADGQTPGRVVRIVDRDTLDAVDPDWHSAAKAAPVVREYAFDKQLPRVFYVRPGVPVAPAVWVDVEWLAEPKRIPDGGEPGSEHYPATGSDPTLIGIHDQFVEDLRNYMVAMLLLKGSKNVQNMPKAQLHATLFTSSINAQAAALTGVNPNLKQLPFVADVGGGDA